MSGEFTPYPSLAVRGLPRAQMPENQPDRSREGELLAHIPKMFRGRAVTGLCLVLGLK